MNVVVSHLVNRMNSANKIKRCISITKTTLVAKIKNLNLQCFYIFASIKNLKSQSYYLVEVFQQTPSRRPRLHLNRYSTTSSNQPLLHHASTPPISFQHILLVQSSAQSPKEKTPGI